VASGSPGSDLVLLLACVLGTGLTLARRRPGARSVRRAWP
jgi:hypothetical protein